MPAEITELYGGEVELRFTPGRHVYKANGQYIPGATTITGFMNNGKCEALKNWAARLVVESLDVQLQPGKSYDEIEVAEMLEHARKAPFRFTKKAQTIGTKAHEWVENWIKYRLDEGPKPRKPVNKQIASAVKAYLQWEEEHEVEYAFTERKVVSLEEWYAGTADIGAWVNGELSLVDLKTSNYLSAEHLYQTAAYAQALNEEFEDDFSNRWVLQLHKENGDLSAYNLNALQGTELKISKWTTIRFNDYETDRRAFNHLRDLYRITVGK